MTPDRTKLLWVAVFAILGIIVLKTLLECFALPIAALIAIFVFLKFKRKPPDATNYSP